MRIRKGDTVYIRSGQYKGKTGKVLHVDNDKQTAVIEGINMRKRHQKPSQKNPRGGRLRKESPVALSNVMVVCDYCDKPTRVRAGQNKEGDKTRICVRCGKEIG